MTSWLRSASRKTLILAGSALLILPLGAVALADGPRAGSPPKTSLNRVVAGLEKPRPQAAGLVGRVQFKNGLIGELPMGSGADPMLTGGSGRFWVDRSGRMRVELQSDGGGGDAQILISSTQLKLWHAAQNTLYILPLAAQKPKATRKAAGVKKNSANDWLNQLRENWILSAPQPGVIAGRPAYSLRAQPKQPMGQIGAIEISWDAQYKLPLAVKLWAKDSDNPVLDISATAVGYESPDPGVFQLSVPNDAKQVNLGQALRDKKQTGRRMQKLSLDKANSLLGIKPPDSLAGQAFTGAAKLGRDVKPRVGIVYGADLNGWMLEVGPAAGSQDSQLMSDVQLGTVSGKGLFTPLGGIVVWQKGGLGYSLIGSHSKQQLLDAATSLVG